MISVAFIITTYIIMAKLNSFIKIEGTLDGLTFYKGKEGYLVRTKGGVSAQRIKNDPAFIRTRENGTEFGHCATSGKLLRHAILPLLTDAKDSSVTPRLTQVMSRVKNADLSSVRGQRQVSVGLSTAAGQEALSGLDFNAQAPLSSVLLSDYSLNTATGEVVISDFIPLQNLGLPEGATHVSLSCGFLNLDFSTALKDLQLSAVFNTAINSVLTPVTLTPLGVPTGTGTSIYLLKIAFFQEINGVQYPLRNGAYNALQILDVL